MSSSHDTELSVSTGESEPEPVPAVISTSTILTDPEPKSPTDPEEIEIESDSLQELPEKKYEYLDHTSDVQIHAWGETLEEAFEQCAMGMFAYMTDIDSVDNIMCQEVTVQAEDLESLLFRFLDEFLFLFSADPYFIARKVKILEFDRNSWKIRAKGYGEPFDLQKHPQGTEVKAITYSNMQIHEETGATQVFVIIDI